VRQKKKLTTNPFNLTEDELAAIHLYTQETPLYRILNERLRSEKRQLLTPFFRYMKLLLKGLYKLPSVSTIVYRGVTTDLSTNFKENQDIIWWGFTSTSSNIKTLEDATFFGSTGARTMFHVEVVNGVDISQYSANAQEAEIILFPGTFLEVKGVLKVDNAKIIQMKQILVPGLIDFKK